MKLLDISLAHRRNLICVESSFATVASILKRNYEMMFIKSWNFNFNENDPGLGLTVGNRISPGEWDRKASLEQYHGIGVNRIRVNNAAEVIEAARHELEVGLPVVIDYDSYFSPWARESDKQNRFITMFLMVGLERDGVNCIDVHYTKNTGYIPMEDFLQGCRPNYTIFSVTHDEVTDFDWHDIVIPVVDGLLLKRNNGNTFDAMRRLADYINCNFNYELELRGGVNIVGYPLIYANFLDLGRGRGRFASVLQYLAKLGKVNSLLEHANRLFYVESQWNLISSELLKAYQNGQIDNHKLGGILSSRIKTIAGLEEQIAGALQKLCRDEILINNFIPWVEEKTLPNDEADEFVFVKLENYFNNKGFGNPDIDNGAGELTGTGEFYLTGGLPQDRLWQVGREDASMKFSFPLVGNDFNDNIACQNQVVVTPVDCYNSIMLLGCAEFGVFYIPILIQYTDGMREEVMVEFIDWGNKDLPKITEAKRPAVAWEGLGVEREQTRQTKKPRYLYAHQHHLKHRSMIQSIILPDCPNVHLFAISLAKMK